MTQYNIMLVGEAWGQQEEEVGEPFVGPSGQVLNGMLSTAGIDRKACYLTNVFNFHPVGNKLDALKSNKAEAIKDWPKLGSIHIDSKYQVELDRLLREIETIAPNIIIALGATALWALCKRSGIKKYRGTPLLTFDGKIKVLPTYHPAAIMRQWSQRPIVISDLGKARNEAAFPELRRPVRLIHLEPTIDDIANFYERYIESVDVVVCDIETKRGTITEVGFAPTIDRAIVIPFYSRRRPGGNYWPDQKSEVAAWKWVEYICREKRLVGQNFSYDIQWLWSKNHIATPQIEDDTMILHHSMYMEMEKSLGFLGSIYTSEPSWKFMRTDTDDFKKDA